MILSIKNLVKDEKLLFKIASGISAIWILAQIVLIACFWEYPHIKGDSGNYISMAQRCFNNGQWYPMVEDVYSIWFCAQGLINLLILQLRIFGTTNFNDILNLFLNIAILFEIYYLGKKFFSKRTGLISVIIFCLFYSNFFIVLEPLTELPFLFLCLSALCLVFSGKWKYVIVAALLFALANWFRPLAIVFLFASAVYFFITKAKFYNYIALIIPYILVLFIIGTITEKKIGYFVYQSQTFGYNLLMTSHDNAKGNVDHYIFNEEDGAGFIENRDSLTFKETDSIWRERSFKWIKEHPIKYIALFFKKIPALYIHDAWPFSGYWFDETVAINFFRDSAASRDIFAKKILFQSLISIPYYLTYLLFFYVLWVNRKKIFSVKAIFPVILITGTIITCIFPVGMRYHYPFIFTVIIYAAWGIDTLIEDKLSL
jgi:4-amino-4-deoxy-L-arabinose transferase-like glycosyltransferase